MEDLNNGITNGYDWYQTYRSRQDYMTKEHDCMEVIIELSNTKLVSESQLDNYWNYKSLLGFIEELDT